MITTTPPPLEAEAPPGRDPSPDDRRPPPALGLVRRGHDRVIAGVASALARRIGVDVTVVRVAFVTLAAAGGAGLVLYVLLGAVSVVDDDKPPYRDVWRPSPSPRRALAFGLQVMGLMLVLRAAGVWLGDALVWPVSVAAVGSGVMWSRSGERDRARWSTLAGRLPEQPFSWVVATPVAPWRVATGLLLIAVGGVTLIATNARVAAASSLVIAVLVTAGGLALVLAPGVTRLLRQLTEERRERIRSEERAEVAAHLHDSVLHTLALIQRSDRTEEMASLARGQERELRAWLNGQGGASAVDLAAAVDAMAGRVERQHRVAVEAVVVGEAELDDGLRALVDAASEAAVNAAKHSGAPEVSVYVEVEPGVVTAFVRDEGKGFDPTAVPADRRGIRHSIAARMQRHGGSCEIHSEPGEGTEVVLTLPRRPE